MSGGRFAFMGRRKCIQIGDYNYYLDLLFYHRILKRLVLVELKLGDFNLNYKGQIGLCPKWLAKPEQQPGQQFSHPVRLWSRSRRSWSCVGKWVGMSEISEWLKADFEDCLKGGRD